MKMIRAIVRPEKVEEDLEALIDAGYPAVTRMEVYGRGKQKGLQVGGVFYSELPKNMFLMVIEDDAEEKVASIIMEKAKTGDGNFGDGRIFVTPVLRAYTVSTMSEGL